MNGNNRSYPYELLKDEIDRLNEEMVEPGRLLGSLEHPDYPECRPEDACVKILEVKEDKNKTWVGKACILADQPEFGIRGTPKGNLLLSLIQYGTPFGFSTRSLGELSKDGTEVVELKLMNYDCVLNPSIGLFCDSNGNRFVDGILESKQFVCDFHPKCERAFGQLEKRLAHGPSTRVSAKKAEFLGKAISDFMASLTK